MVQVIDIRIMMTQVEQSANIARIALFFAKSDGVVANEEKKVIADYIKKLQDQNIIKNEKDLSIFNTISSVELFTMDEVVATTKTVIDNEPKNTHRMITNAMTSLIEAIILADGVVTADESENFNKWKAQLSF